MQDVGFVGLGAMGTAISKNLLQAGFRLQVFNRTREKAEQLAREPGVTVGSRPSELAVKGRMIVSMLADDKALEQVVTGPGGLSEGAAGIVHISMSTVSPDTARRMAQIHTNRGDRFVSAPVFGRPEAAAARKLWICESGEPDAKAEVRHILEAMGQGIFDFGEDPGAANVVKLAGNFLIASAIEAMAEAFTLGEKNGLDRGKMAEMFAATLFACPIYLNYGRLVAEQGYDKVGFSLPLGLKDMQLLQATAVTSRVPMPFAAIVRDRLVAAMAKGREGLDWTGFALSVSEDAGLATDKLTN
ncbi:MAG: NAD(P)-dependent oxidoreductase [Acidobacteria bacterium]|nr:MAG: NAD(P)-dependent oxidoreductase [Acidobacteriota bacterium]